MFKKHDSRTGMQPTSTTSYVPLIFGNHKYYFLLP